VLLCLGLPFYDFNLVATADSAGLHDAAYHASAAAYLFLKSISNLVHQVARRAWHDDFEKRFANAHAPPQLQFPDRNPARRNVFLAAPRRNAEFLKRFDIRHQNLPAASSMEAVLKPLVFNGKYFAKFPDWLTVRDRLKQVQDFTHRINLRQRAIW
jgi:hypothetical protein